MKRVRRGTAGTEAGRAALAILRSLLRAASLILLALVRPREQPLSGLSDVQLADIGLTRADVTRPHERTLSAELEMERLMERLLRGRDWR